MPNVHIDLGKKIKVENTDNTIEIAGQGKLIFSKGSVEWKPLKNSVNQLKFTWAQFAKALESSGTPVAIRKPAKKKGAAGKTTSTAKATKVTASKAVK